MPLETFRAVTRLLLSVLPALLLLGIAHPIRAEVVITEFMAQNTRTLKDEDGEFVDWIEIQNQGSNAVSLLNWSLTDASGNRRKWVFPATNLPPSEFLVVFASEKNRAIPGRPLHTSFKLSDGGEYLALIKPDGVTVATEFAPRFVPQRADVSYGYGMEVVTRELIASNAPSRWWVPSLGHGDAWGDGWMGGEEPFDDSLWNRGTGAVGFLKGNTNLVGASSLAVRLNFEAPLVGDLVVDSKPTGLAHPGTNHNALWVESSLDAGASPMRRVGVLHFEANDSSQVVISPSTDFNGTRGTITFWIRSAGNQGPGSQGAILFDRRSTRGDVIVLSDDGRLFVQALSAPGQVRNSFFSNQSVADNLWHCIAYAYDQTATGATSIYIDGVLDRTQANTATWSWDSTRGIELGSSHDPFWKRFTGDLDDFRFYKRLLTAQEIAEIRSGDGVAPITGISTDVGNAMLGINGSVLVRIPFLVNDPDAISLLTLKIRYDAGFAARLNGQDIAQDNLPAPLVWNAFASGVHSSSATEEITFGGIRGLLRAGTNILAIQAATLPPNPTGFLLEARLSGTELGRQTTSPRYFLKPTPGSPNGGGSADLGPIFEEVGHSPQVPLDSEDLFVTARLSPSFQALGAVTLKYRVMFGVTNSVPMADDGVSGDGAAGDGVYGARIPASDSGPGQMVRYFIQASDTAGHVSRWPLFESPLDSEEYLGTVVQDSNVITALPLYQLFAKATASMDTDAGTQASFFYKDQLYDNVFVRLKGGTTRGLNKSAHRVDFHKSHPFKFSDSEKPVRELALNAEFIDPSFLRQNTSFWLFNQAGTPAPIHFPVRLHLNGQFHELAFHTETMDSALLERMGLNPEGALYKNALMLNILPEPAIGGRDCLEAEKQTRPQEGFSDLIAWTTGIAENRTPAQRRTHMLDTTDIPSVINYLACFHMTQQADGVHANVCPHRDSGVTDEWRLIPWDMNLSMGQVWAVDHVAGNEDASESHPFYGASGWRDSNISWSYNRLFDSLIVVPEFREMYLRRLRTLMDAFLRPPGSAADQLRLEARITEMRQRIEPEALADRKKWGWPSGYGGYTMTNVPFGQAVDDLLQLYVKQRRTHFYGTHSLLNSSYANRAGIPDSQPVVVTLQFGRIEATPASGNPAEEFVELVNTNGFAVDLSGWQLTGAIRFQFKPGTVIPSGGRVFVSPDVKAFRSRSVEPRGGQGLFVVGPYQGQLSNRGETLGLVDVCQRSVASLSFAGQLSEAQQFLRISSLMYAPKAAASGPYSAEDFEYLELINLSTGPLDVTGVRLTEGVQFLFPADPRFILGGGERVVVVKNLEAFRSRYGLAPRVAGVYTGSLNNGGESMVMLDALGEKILDFEFSPEWQRTTDGLGFALTRIDLGAPVSAWGASAGWRAGLATPGAAGGVDPVEAQISVVINEVLANSVSPEQDRVELYNAGSASIDVGNWFLTDDLATPGKYRIPAGTSIAAHGYLILSESQFNPKPGVFPSFALSASGDELGLFAANAAGALTGYSDTTRLPASFANVSLGRVVDADGVVGWVSQKERTFGSQNSGARVGPLVVSEVFYHEPFEVAGGTFEFVELLNVSGQALSLETASMPEVGWKLEGDIGFMLSPQWRIPARGLMVVVGFDPVSNPEAVTAFRTRFGLPADAMVVGPYQGSLNHAGGVIQLMAPSDVVTEVSTGVEIVNYAVVDAVVVDDIIAEQRLADGSGASLHRRLDGVNTGSGEDWFVGRPSPGFPPQAGTSPVIVESPASSTTSVGSSLAFSVKARGDSALRYQWRFNGDPLPGAVLPTLQLSGVQLSQSGCYDVVVMSDGGATASEPATLTVRTGPVFTAQPASQVVAVGSNVVMKASAVGRGVLKYQWWRDENPISNATNANLSLPSVVLEDGGPYAVTASDEVGSLRSEIARLTVAVLPVITVPPQSVVVIPGEQAEFSVAVTGTPPFTYRWRRGNVVVNTQNSDRPLSFFAITNPLASSAGTYSVQVLNLLGAAKTTPSATLALAADADADGMSDAWELAHGLNPKVADAALDPDGDGMSNLQEYWADTDPQDATSRFALSVGMDASLPWLEFEAKSNHTYSLQILSALGEGSGTWQHFLDFGTRPASQTLRIWDTNSLPTTRFYRLISPARP